MKITTFDQTNFALFENGLYFLMLFNVYSWNIEGNFNYEHDIFGWLYLLRNRYFLQNDIFII